MISSTSLCLSLVLSRAVNARDMHDRFNGWIEHFHDRIQISARVEKIADVERFQILIAIKLLIIGVGHGLEFGLVLRRENRLGIAPKIGAGHRDDMNLVAPDELRRVGCPDGYRDCC